MLPGIAAAATTEFVQVEEEGGEEDTEHVEREGVGKDEINENKVTINIKEVVEDPPDYITDRTDSDVDISKLLTESDVVVFTTTASIQSGEGKESDSGEDNEGGLSVEDLQRGFREKVRGGEERKEE